MKNVQFDVAVTVSASAEGEARGGLQVLGLDIGGKGTLSRENSAVSRIQFEIPIVAPTMQIDQDATRERKARLANAPRSYDTGGPILGT